MLRRMARIDDEDLGAWRAFLTAHARITRAISRDLAAAGLPDLAWYDLLWALYRAPGRRLRVNELAREVVLSPTAMSRFVDRVEAAGYVRREPDPDDRRALQVTITDTGSTCCGGCGRSTRPGSSATSRRSWGSPGRGCGRC